MSGGLPANFSFKKRKGKKLKARKFDIGAQLRKEAQPVKIEKTEEEKAAEEVVKTSEWQEAQSDARPASSFRSNFGSIQKIVEVRKKPQEHVLKRKTREDGRAIIQNVINAAKENKKKEPNKEEPKSKLGVYRPGSWMSRAKKKEEFKMNDEAFPAMNSNAASTGSAPTVAQDSVWAPAVKEKETPPTKIDTTAKSASGENADNTPPLVPAEAAPPAPPSDTTADSPPAAASTTDNAETAAEPDTVNSPKKNKFKKKKKKKKKSADVDAAGATATPTEATPAPTTEAATSEVVAAETSTPSTTAPEVEPTVVKKKANKFKKKKKKKKKVEE